MSNSIEETIIIEINEDGSKVTLNAEGFSGQGCSVALHQVSQALGQLTEMTQKSEFYDKENDDNVIVSLT